MTGQQGDSKNFMDGAYNDASERRYGGYDLVFREGRFEGVESFDFGRPPASDLGRFVLKGAELQLIYDMQEQQDREESRIASLHYRNVGGVGVLLIPEALALYEKSGILPHGGIWVRTVTTRPFYYYCLARAHPKFAAAMPEAAIAACPGTRGLTLEEIATHLLEVAIRA